LLQYVLLDQVEGLLISEWFRLKEEAKGIVVSMTCAKAPPMKMLIVVGGDINTGMGPLLKRPEQARKLAVNALILLRKSRNK